MESNNPTKLVQQLDKLDKKLDQLLQDQADYCQQRFIDQSKD